MKFPKHEGELSLTHNEHKSYYKTVHECVENDELYGDEYWVSMEQKQKALDSNECWILQWYPYSPTGFELLIAADLHVLLQAASES